MAFIPNSNSVVAFQSDPTKLQVSVTGRVDIGNFSAIPGSVVSFPVSTNASVNTIAYQLAGSVMAVNATVNTGNSSVQLVGGTAMIGSVVAYQGAVPWKVELTSGSVITVGGNSSVQVVGLMPPQSVSGVGTFNINPIGNGSIIGTLINSSVTTLQGTNPWIITGSVQGSFSPAANQSVSGTIITNQGTTPWTIAGSASIAGSYIEDTPHNSGDLGVFLLAIRNDSGSVLAGNDGDYIGLSTDMTGAVRVDLNGAVSALNSSTSNLLAAATFTGPSEDVLNYNEIRIDVFADQASAVDGLSIQQSSNGTNWDITDTYTIPASTGKTFSVPRQARFFRLVYTNGGTNQGAFRLQTIFNRLGTKSSSQRASDGYTNETDLEQDQTFGMVYNGATWDRMYGSASTGVNVSILGIPRTSIVGGVVGVTQVGTWAASIVGVAQPASVSGVGTFNVNPVGNGSVITTPQPASVSGVGLFNVNHTGNGSVITVFSSPSIVGTYAEDAGHATNDKGLFALGVRNETLSSITSNDLDYSPLATGPSGEVITANAPLTKWIQGTGSMLGGTPVSGGSVAVISAQGANTFTYITGVQIVNASANNVWLRFDGGTSSIVGFTIAPANGGSNIVFPNALKTVANAAFTASVSGISSIYISAQGFSSKS